MDQTLWKKVLETLRTISPSVEILLKSSKLISFDDKNLTLGVYYKFHKEMLEEYRNKSILESIIQKVTEKAVCVHCVLSEPSVKIQKSAELVESQEEDIAKVAEELFAV